MPLKRAVCLVVLAGACSPAQQRAIPRAGYRGWSVYGGGVEQIRYSRLDQIVLRPAHDRVFRLATGELKQMYARGKQ